MSSGQVTFFRSKDDIRAEEREEKDGGEDVKEEEEEDDDDSSSAASSSASEDSKDKEIVRRSNRQSNGLAKRPQWCLLRKYLRRNYADKGKKSLSLNLLLAHVNLDELAESRNRVSDWIELAIHLKAVQTRLEKGIKEHSEARREVLESSLVRLRARLDFIFQDSELQSRAKKAILTSDQARAFNVCNQLQRQLSKESRRQQISSTQKSPHLWSNVERCLRTSIEAGALESGINIICMGVESAFDSCLTYEEKQCEQTSLPSYDLQVLQDLDIYGVERLTICGSDLTWYMCLSGLPLQNQRVKSLRLNTHAKGQEAMDARIEFPPNLVHLQSLKELIVDRFRCHDRTFLHQGIYSHIIKEYLQDNDYRSAENWTVAPLGAHCVAQVLQSVPFASMAEEVFEACPQHIRALVDHTYVCVSCQRIVSFEDDKESATTILKQTPQRNKGRRQLPLIPNSYGRGHVPLISPHILPPLSEVTSREYLQRRFWRKGDLPFAKGGKEDDSKTPEIYIGGRGCWLQGESTHWVDWRFCYQCAIAHLRIEVDDHQEEPPKCRCIVCQNQKIVAIRNRGGPSLSLRLRLV